jgi:hypothetical protein
MVDDDRSAEKPRTVKPTTKSALDQTLARVSIEQNPGAGHQLSADCIAYTDDGYPIVSVINMETREHWWLVVMTDGPGAKRGRPRRRS